MSKETLDLIAIVRNGLGRARTRIVMVSLLRGLLLFLGVSAGLLAAVAGLEAILWAPSVWRAVLGSTVLGVSVLLVAWFMVRPLLLGWGLLPGLSDLDVARYVGRSNHNVADRLINLLQLAAGNHSNAPDAIVDQAVRRLAEPMAAVPFERVASYRSVVPVARLAAIPVLGLLVLLLAAPSPMFSAANRLLHPSASFDRPAPFSFMVDPGDVERITGGSLTLSIRIQGRSDGVRPVVETNVIGEVRSQTRDLEEGSDAAWSATFDDIRQAFRYRVSASGVASPWYMVRLVDRPLVQQVQVSLSYPAYTRIPPRQLDPNVGDMTAVPGTRATVRTRLAGAVVASADMVFGSGDSLSMDLSSMSADATFTIRRPDTWSVSLVSTEGTPNASPISYRISVTQDAAPTISILSPEPLADLDDDRRAFLLLHLTDDFGFSDATLHYRLAESRFGAVSDSFSVLDLPLAEPYLLDQEMPVDWDIASMPELDPVPGDVIEYFVEVRDNDVISGRKSAQSRVQRVRMPSLAEQYQSIDAVEDDAEDSIEDLMEQAEKAREEFDELRKQLLQNPDPDFEDERALEKLQEQQQKMDEAVNALTQKMEELADEMSQNDLVSDETMETFEELQQVVEEVRTPELMDALQQLEESIDEMNPNQMQEAMENFEFSENLYQQRLERTLNLFKNFRVQQDLEEVERRTDDLAKTEEQLAEETAQEAERPDQEQAAENLDKLADQQDQAAEEMKSLEEKMDEIRERMEELKNQPSEKMQDLLEDTQDQKIPEQMEQNAEEMREGDPSKAQQQQQDMAEQLQQLSGDLSNMQMNTAGAQMQLNMAGLRSALEDVLTLSRDQETLRREVSGFAADSPLVREASQSQSRLSEGLSVVADSLQRIAREVPQMSRAVQEETGNALRQMEEATNALTERVARQATGAQRGAMTNLNELALLLSDLLNQMNNSSGSGQSNMSMEQMMEQMQQMGQQQQQLNQQIQQLLNDMQGNRLTQDMTERLRQMGAQQDQIRQQLRELSRNRELRNKALGDLNRIAEQMAETIEELQTGGANRRTIERQQEILTRLLEASKSLEQRGREKKREGRSAEEIMRQSPADLTPSEQVERMRRDLIRALESGYADDFQALIRRYFELLQEAPQ